MMYFRPRRIVLILANSTSVDPTGLENWAFNICIQRVNVYSFLV